MLKALVWDVDGTLAETERDGHRVAFNAAFAEAGLPWHWDESRYGELLQVTGGFERLIEDMTTQPDAPLTPGGRESLGRSLHRSKNAHYERLMAEGFIRLRPGVRELMDEAAAAGLRMAIATTSSRGNVAALLQAQLGVAWPERFVALLGAEDALAKKPDPLVYQLALKALGTRGEDTLAIEDSPAGAQAARAAGLPFIVTRSLYFPRDSVAGALAIGPGLDRVDGWTPEATVAAGAGRIDLAQLRDWQDAAQR